MSGHPSLLHALFHNAQNRGRDPALRYKADGTWHDISWDRYLQQVLSAGAGLHALGLRAGDTVGILSTNRVEWLVGDLATLALGCISVPIYPNSIPAQIEYILQHSGATALFVEDGTQAHKVLSVRHSLPDLKHIIVSEGGLPEGEGLMSWSDLVKLGEAQGPAGLEQVEDLAQSLASDAAATIVYTSGTTGPPKGALLSHGNMIAMATSLAGAMELGEGDSSLSFLPLSHIAERLQGEIMAISSGYTVNLGEGLDHVAVNLVEVEPTILVCVPRLWEKYYANIRSSVEDAPDLRKKLFGWALQAGSDAFEARLAGRRLTLSEQVRSDVADRLVLGPLRKKLGMARGRAFLSGAAPLSATVGRFFASLGIVIQEVYGQTECVGICTFNPPGQPRFGTVGVPVPGIELKIAEDGEILVRGPNVFLGYFKQPSDTAETIIDGWLHTGDVGEQDSDGYVRITDRKKDIIVTAGGKNVSPQNIENRLKTYPGISQVVVVGDKRKFLSCLVTLDIDGMGELWDRQGKKLPAGEVLSRDREVRSLLQGYVEEVNKGLASYETLKKFAVLPEDFTVDSGELTPSLKVKRRVIQQRYEALIDGFYSEKFV
jgi:long-chain acyl-CoA synthetase